MDAGLGYGGDVYRYSPAVADVFTFETPPPRIPSNACSISAFTLCRATCVNSIDVAWPIVVGVV